MNSVLQELFQFYLTKLSTVFVHNLRCSQSIINVVSSFAADLWQAGSECVSLVLTEIGSTSHKLQN
ncbi:hypothetical Protein YC6258_02890 [Gynuella sunshinyii YC6258]|uniref:Uncharacterized protein n=1 Tax=Gynuella sunshinyii YC6258 TaxID=1445510 RepID=A0A0C5VNF8_9GAMM|nr:hypothetical Protein YC6258_02890 [Gynuella sunshinyii YC6258]